MQCQRLDSRRIDIIPDFSWRTPVVVPDDGVAGIPTYALHGALIMVQAIVGAVFVAMIAAIWVFAAVGKFAGAAWAITRVFVEVVISRPNAGTNSPSNAFA